MTDQSATEPDAQKPAEADRSPGDAVSRSEAVRRALAAGFDDPRQGTAYILKELGIEVSLSHFSAVLATERKKGWTKKGKPGRKPPKNARQPDAGGLNLQSDETDLDDDE